MSIFFFTAKLVLYAFKDRIIDIGRWLVSHYVAGRPYHHYDISVYMERVSAFYLQLVDSASICNIYIASSVVLCIMAIAFAIFMIKGYKVRPLLKPVLFGMIFIDIYVFSFYGTGFKGNMLPLKSLEPAHNGILNILRSDTGLFRIAPFGMFGKNDFYWALPNTNILPKIDSIAVYTPLAGLKYKESLLPLQVVDNSLGVIYPSEKALSEIHQLLRLLNVKYIISDRELTESFLKEVCREDAALLYRLNDDLPRIFFTDSLEDAIEADPSADLAIKEYDSGRAGIEMSSLKKGYVIFSEYCYPGWKAYVDGREVPIKKFREIIQAIEILPGHHKVDFVYKPYGSLLEK